MSPPARGRGLKLLHRRLAASRRLVAPRAGAWIETRNAITAEPSVTSPPARGRGLKLDDWSCRLSAAGSPPARGRGLKPRRPEHPCQSGGVAPRAGAWIETLLLRIPRNSSAS